MRFPRWSSLPLRTKGLLVVALTVLPLLFFWSIVGIALVRRSPPANTTYRNLQVQAGLARVLNALLDADGGVRDYLLTDNQGARIRYQNAVARLAPTFDDLERRVIDPNLRTSLTALRGLVEEQLTVLAGLAGDPLPATPEAGERALLDLSIELMDRIRAVMATIEQRQMALANERSAQAARRSRQYFWLFVIGSAVCTVGGVVAALVLARGISRRHAVLADNVGRLARGETPRPLPPGDVEIAWLDAQFRDAASHLRHRQAELRQAVDRLETTNRELESFSYSVSHDLRAPLRAISGFSQALEEDCADRLDDAGRDSLRRIRGGAARMGLLIDDLLVLSQITRMDLRREPVDVTSTAAAVVAELTNRTPSRSVEVVIAPGVSAHADPRMLRIALENLIDNAWKYTEKVQTPRIEVGTSVNGGAPVYYVRDNGAGFDMQYAGKLFGAFQRLHHEQQFSGTGIGLATVQRIVHRHGGHIWADAAVDAGASFFFTLEPPDVPS